MRSENINPEIKADLDAAGGYASTMTLRDHFAAAALQGLASSHHELMDNDALVSKMGTEWIFKLQANVAYRLADAMLKARGK